MDTKGNTMDKVNGTVVGFGTYSILAGQDYLKSTATGEWARVGTVKVKGRTLTVRLYCGRWYVCPADEFTK